MSVSGLYGVSEKSGYNFFENNTELWMGGFYWGSLGGLIACWAALATNTLAFILYLVKALCVAPCFSLLLFRSLTDSCAFRRLRSNEAESVGRRVARHFVRTLESGTIFAIIWVRFSRPALFGRTRDVDGRGSLLAFRGSCSS